MYYYEQRSTNKISDSKWLEDDELDRETLTSKVRKILVEHDKLSNEVKSILFSPCDLRKSKFEGGKISTIFDKSKFTFLTKKQFYKQQKHEYDVLIPEILDIIFNYKPYKGFNTILSNK